MWIVEVLFDDEVPVRGDGGGESSVWFAIRSPPSAWERFKSPSISPIFCSV